jgi:hypothetical protein
MATSEFRAPFTGNIDIRVRNRAKLLADRAARGFLA